jgi:hypothetical protein
VRLPGRLGRILERRVKRGEELISGSLALALAPPHHPSAAVIADQRQVTMPLAPRA